MGGGHHIYKAGLNGDACEPKEFRQTYWTHSARQAGGSALIGTAFAQNYIWEHQHPDDCRNATFLIWVPSRNGIGSNLHCIGQVLGYALNLNRVLLLAHDPDHPYYDPSYCKESSYHECYFERISSCSLSDAALVTGVDELDLSGLTEVRWVEADRPNEATVKLSLMPEQHFFAPSVFTQFLKNSPIEASKHHYWWKAQAVAFLVRPNKRVLEEIEARKRSNFHRHIRQGTISCHIRHGDKWMEAAIVEDEYYMRAIEELWTLSKSQRKQLRREIFLSTEDPSSIDYFSNNTSWTTLYTLVPRKPDRRISNIQYAEQIGKANEMINSLLNLDLALECDAWVGTMTSNWCRLIDELRSTVRCKSDGMYWDAEQKNPPSDLVW